MLDFWLLPFHILRSKYEKVATKNQARIQAKELIFDIISTITNQKIEIVKTNFEKEYVWLRFNDKEELELLGLASQGFENLFGWIGVLVKRLYEIQPNTQYTNLVDIPAIVLIDEIDTYLHISVQQKILAVLVEKFPNIQFIVTTHSPYVLGSIPKDKIKIYVCKKEAESVEIEEFTDFTAYGADMERLSRWLFDTNEINKEVQGMLNNIFRLIENRELDAAEQAILSAAQVIAHNHPRLEEARMIIETQRMFSL